MKVTTVGDLKALLAKYPDDMRVVVNGYEGGYDDFGVVEMDLVLYTRGASELGPHDEPWLADNESLGTTRCLVFDRHYWDDKSSG
jgi:hypothetical protein